MKAELTKRLGAFGKNLVVTFQMVPMSTINRNSIEKCIEAWCNAGQEYSIAGSAATKKLFTFHINLTKQNLNACSYWLELLSETATDMRSNINGLFMECKELAQIFNKISWTLKKNISDDDDNELGWWYTETDEDMEARLDDHGL